MRIASWVTFGKFSKFRAVFFKAKTDFADQNDDITKQNIFLKKCEIYFPVGTWRFNRFYFTLFHFVKKMFCHDFHRKMSINFRFQHQISKAKRKTVFFIQYFAENIKIQKIYFSDF